MPSPKWVSIHTIKIASMERWSLWSLQYQDQLYVVDLHSVSRLRSYMKVDKNLRKLNKGKCGWSKIVLCPGGSNPNSAGHGVDCLESDLVEELLGSW